MTPLNVYFLFFSTFVTLLQTLNFVNTSKGLQRWYSGEEYESCKSAIYAKFGGKKYRYDISIYALEHLTMDSFVHDETTYARDYYYMFSPNIYAYNIKSPKRFCQYEGKDDYEQCAYQLLTFGTSKVEGLLYAFYYNSAETVKGKKYATEYLQKTIKEMELKQATPNPDEFCANKQSPYDTLYAGDRDGEGWEEDTYMLNMT